MRATLAAIVVAGQGTRMKLIDDEIIPSLEGFDEVIVVGSHHDGGKYRYLYIPDLTKSTNDALIKRDSATLACRADIVTYLADDHALLPGFADELRRCISDALFPWDCLIPSRWADHPEQGRIRIPNGEEELYCAGHCGVFRRRVIQSRPWAAQKHHRNWDLISSHEWQAAGYHFVSYPKLRTIDLEPQNSPWL